ncbi:MAG: glycosyltransferase family 39 protein [Gemmatimonadota bacterium]|nr:glycosyltransferase family 39 protein [Gemmatimonadota bacterium]
MTDRPPLIARIALLAAATALCAWAFWDPGFRDAEGFLTGAVTLPAAVSVAILLVLLGAAAGVARAAIWLALALIGQAASHQLVAAGPFVRYQHYLPIEGLVSGNRTAPVLVVVVQAFVVGVAFVKLWPRVRAALQATFTGWQIACIGVVFVLTSATFSRRPADYAGELVIATVVQLVALCNVALAVSALPPSALQWVNRRTAQLFGGEPGGGEPEPGGVDRFAIIAALTVTVVAALLSVLSYERHPHVPDEVVYLLHGRYFAAGKLFLPAPPVPAAFDVDLLSMTRARWYSPVPPGWPAALAGGTLVGAPWLVNPLLAGLNVLLAYLLLREMYARRTTRLTIVLLCASPWYVFMGMNFMTHMFTMTAALAGAVAVARLVRTGRPRWAWAGGSAIGVISLIRPLEGLLVAGLLGLWTLRTRGRRRRVLAAASLIVSSIAVGAIVLPYNKALTGNATEFPMSRYVAAHYEPGSNNLGFGSNRGLGWVGLDPFPGHRALDVVLNAGLNAFSVNVELLGWATGSLLLLAAFVFSKKRWTTSDRMMLTVILGVVGIHSFYWFSGGPDFGARYWFLILLPCLALTARAIEVLPDISTGGGASGINQHRVRLLSGVLALSGMALVTFFPWRAIDKYHHYRGMRPDVRELAAGREIGRSLVLIRGKRHPDYASAAVYNPMSLDDDAPVYAWARTPAVAAAVAAAFPDRPQWVLNGPSITGRGFEVGAGPQAMADGAISRLSPR